MTIKFESDARIMQGELIDIGQLDNIVRLNCKGLTYLMNVMDDNTANVYMWFKDDEKNKSYFLRIE